MITLRFSVDVFFICGIFKVDVATQRKHISEIQNYRYNIINGCGVYIFENKLHWICISHKSMYIEGLYKTVHTAVQSQRAVAGYLKSKQLPHFGFAQQHRWTDEFFTSSFVLTL